MISRLGKAFIALLMAAPCAALANDFPNRPVTIVVPYSAGGSTDVAARIVGEGLSKQLAQPVIIDNKPGAGGTIGTMAVKNAPADGYTLLITSASHIVNNILQPELTYNIEEDFVPLSQITQLPIVLVVNKDSQIKSLPDLIAAAKKSPGALNFGTAGIGTIQHVSAMQLLDKADIDATHVAYKGGAAALTDLIGGQIDFTFSPIVEVLSYIESGRVRPLAVTTTERSAALPAVPTLAESVPGYDSFHWNGFVVRKGTPAENVAKLSDALVKATKDPAVIAKLKSQGTDAKGEGAQALADLMKAEKDRLTPLLSPAVAASK
ncbi:Bug family tripartite tricarboxylate transporter substrate binding protein [Bordetella sp. 02P26C-1]|uniref:Bug family tripartite tricarboxylate transporter substrate binding protein n=1 Tax=Bordetella sp. 02P26C-1 TaxID=2683195 RepID=UPI0013541A15|nr:tripartite tricarboxylate transporter substrate binding protein [Bordetella sp. 02P26C-1]MVW78410.1 tripartite tricarboxylate transporter substrate binding protein [Bordetella sp. 02P26C-1]